MTDQEARDTIREVTVMIGGNLTVCQVGGAKKKFAVVHLPSGGTVETSWGTIERIVRNGTHLIV